MKQHKRDDKLKWDDHNLRLTSRNVPLGKEITISLLNFPEGIDCRTEAHDNRPTEYRTFKAICHSGLDDKKIYPLMRFEIEFSTTSLINAWRTYPTNIKVSIVCKDVKFTFIKNKTSLRLWDVEEIILGGKDDAWN